MYENISIVSDVSIHELFASAKAVVTINSGSGFEALLHLKPVITLGKADYSAVPYECKTLEDIENSKHFINKPVDSLRIKRFFHAYFANTYKWHGAKTYPELIKLLIQQNQYELNKTK